ncbi:MAG: hypothetical protein CL438_09930 [Acidimicrobiaceae bacterium]|nr:hypothetical protein [Acidimicrobiaceae bacterium]|tara:strand:+ start:5618 stop:5881 length:264 start_codon:yes stop_codon:yes gene_type:complete
MERNILVPVVGEDIGILSILVPKDVICQIEQEALEILDMFESHPAGQGILDPNNKMMQATSFVVQNAFGFYLENHMKDEDEIIPPYE